MPQTIAKSGTHRVLPRKLRLFRFDPPNHPPPSDRPGHRRTAAAAGRAVSPRNARRRVSRVLYRPWAAERLTLETVTAIPLGRPSPGVSCDRPERRREGPPDAAGSGSLRAAASAAPTWSCSRWGFPCRRRCRRRGALLPHRFTLAARPVARSGSAVCFLWHCPWGRPRRALPGTVPPWSPDFPLPAVAKSGRPAVWQP